MNPRRNVRLGSYAFEMIPWQRFRLEKAHIHTPTTNFTFPREYCSTHLNNNAPVLSAEKTLNAKRMLHFSAIAFLCLTSLTIFPAIVSASPSMNTTNNPTSSDQTQTCTRLVHNSTDTIPQLPCGDSAKQRILRNTPVSPQATGWDEDTVYGPVSCGWFCTRNMGAFGATVYVPSDPKGNDNQLDYFFIGLEDSGGSQIIQPVLTWGTACGHGGAYWWIAAWFVWGSQCNQATVGPVYQTYAGHQLSLGLAKGPSGNSWTIVIQDNNLLVTSSETVNTNTMQVAYTAFEMYNFVQCIDFPANGNVVFQGMTINDDHGNAMSPGWSTETHTTHGCGETPQVNAQGTNSQTTLSWYRTTTVRIDSHPTTDFYTRSHGWALDRTLPVPWWPPYQSGYEFMVTGGAFSWTTYIAVAPGQQYVQEAASGSTPTYAWHTTIYINGAWIGEGDVGRNQILFLYFNT